MDVVKHIPNIITTIRILGAVCLLLLIAVPMAFWSIVPIAIVAGVATFAAIQEGHLIRKGYSIDSDS